MNVTSQENIDSTHQQCTHV